MAPSPDAPDAAPVAPDPTQLAFKTLIDGIGSNGFAVFALCRAIEVLTPLASTKYPTLQSTIQTAKDHVYQWASLGGQDALYATLSDVQTVHGYLRAATSPLVFPGTRAPQAKQDFYTEQNFRLWSDAKQRARVVRNLTELLQRVRDLASASAARQKAVADFQALIASDVGALNGLLEAMDPEKDQGDIASLQKTITQDQQDISDKNKEYATEASEAAAAGVGAVAAMGVGVALIAAAPATGPGAAVMFGLGVLVIIGGSAAGGAFAGSEASAAMATRDEINAKVKEIVASQARILELQAEIAAATVLSSQLQPLSTHLSDAAAALTTAVSAWASLETQVQNVLKAAASVAGSQGPSTESLIALSHVMSTFHEARDRAVVMQSAPLIPIIQHAN
ncbi:MAG: hypothetical protein K8S98_06415 [Planctomycetes bacterium]|nr:hypothetical protein [Planctomycetota bacterium]